jgi:hypothetical protein
MSGELKTARLRDGRAYTGNQQYAGNGTLRSCAKCGQHKPVAGFGLRRPWGMVCGGPIEIAVISSDRKFRWVRHKEWDAAIAEGAM